MSKATAATSTQPPGVEQKERETIPAAKIPYEWKLDFNCRAPSRGSKAYKDMMETLRKEPLKFYGRNRGIHIALETGKPGQILDGGHTWLALTDARREGINVDGVFADVTIYRGLNDKEKAEKSKYLNNSVTPPLRGEMDVMGEWDGLKKHLASKYEDLYEFRPHTKPDAPFKVDFLVQLLNALTADTGERSYSAPGVLVRLYKEEKYQRHLKRINDAIELFSTITKDLISDKRLVKMDGVREDRSQRLPNGDTIKTQIPDGYVWPVFSAFSLALDEDGNWKEDPFKLWAGGKTRMVTQLLKDIKANGENPTKVGKNRECYLAQQRWIGIR